MPVVSLLIATVCIILVCAKSVPTGMLATAGLTLIAVGCIASLDDWAWTSRAGRLEVIGVFLIIAGMMWRWWIKGIWLRMSMRSDVAYFLAYHMGIERRSARRSADENVRRA